MKPNDILFRGSIENKNHYAKVFNVGGTKTILRQGVNDNITITNNAIWKEIKFDENMIITRAAMKEVKRVKKIKGEEKQKGKKEEKNISLSDS